jgi:hypothetical protein
MQRFAVAPLRAAASLAGQPEDHAMIALDPLE